MMNIYRTMVLSICLTALSATASAVVIDFKAMADNPPGERGTQFLQFDINGDLTTTPADVFLTIGAGFVTQPTLGPATLADVTFPPSKYTYLDAGNAGLGVCGDLTSSDQCTPSSDDNVTGDLSIQELLFFGFDQFVTVEKIWLNNNHDGDRSLEGDRVSIDLVNSAPLSAPDATGDSLLMLNKSTDFMLVGMAPTCAPENGVFNNCEFYVSKIQYSVPEPTSLFLLGLGLAGLGFVRRRTTA